MPSDSEKERPRRTSWERGHLCCPEGEGKLEQIIGSQVTEDGAGGVRLCHHVVE